MRAAEVTGVGVTLFNNGRVSYSKAFGLRDVEKQLPLTEDSVMAGASLSKVAFSYLVMHLVADRTLDLDKPVQREFSASLRDPGGLGRVIWASRRLATAYEEPISPCGL